MNISAPLPRLPLRIDRETALRMGYTHEGIYFGVPVWVRLYHDEADVLTKFAPLELWLSLCLIAIHFLSSLRTPRGESGGMFHVKPIPGGLMHHQHDSPESWIDDAARYILDHSDLTDLTSATQHATELADEQANDFGQEVQDWVAPEAAAYILMSEDWPDPGLDIR